MITELKENYFNSLYKIFYLYFKVNETSGMTTKEFHQISREIGELNNKLGPSHTEAEKATERENPLGGGGRKKNIRKVKNIIKNKSQKKKTKKR
jgi:hypothetical protein